MIPDLSDVLDLLISDATGSMSVAIPGVIAKVVSSNVADVAPAIQKQQGTQDGAVLLRDLPVVPSVPVLFPGGAGCGIAWDLAVGDPVMLIVCDSDPAPWFASAKKGVPQDTRPHHISNAIALPIGISVGTKGRTIRLDFASCEVGGNVPLATAAKVLAELTKIKTAAAGSGGSGDAFAAAVAALSFTSPASASAKGAA